MNPGVEIVPRKPVFDHSDVTQRWFWDNNALLTTYFAALSATFPDGERFFIRSVRQYQDQITAPQLRSRVRNFCRQESAHAAIHTELDRLMNDLGLETQFIERHFRGWIQDLYARMSPEQRLARTVCVEHFTALLADFHLTTDSFAGMPPSIDALMRWHAVEELEHKSVAFDVYMQCVGDRRLLRWQMLLASEALQRVTARYQLHILRRNRHLPSLREWRGYAQFTRSMFRSIGPDWRAFHGANFHPWDNDNRNLIENWKRDNPALAAA